MAQTYVYLTDSAGNTWQISVNTLGQLVQTAAPAGASQSPAKPTSQTPRNWIRQTLIDMQAISPVDTVSSSEEDDARNKLNMVIEEFNVDGLAIYATTRKTLVLTPSTLSYTIGTGGSIDADQPVFLQDAGLIPSGGTQEAPIKVLTKGEWAGVTDKTTTGPPWAIYFQKSSGILGTIYPFYVPDQAHTLVLYLPVQLSSITTANLSTTYNLPPSYQEAIQWALAAKLAPSYGKVLEVAAFMTLADLAKGKLRAVNIEPIVGSVDIALKTFPRPFDITSGDYY